MKLALFNIQNIFHRHIDLVDRYDAENKHRWTAEFESLLGRSERSPKEVDRMRTLSHFLGFDQDRPTPYFTLRNLFGQVNLKRGVDKEMPKASHLTNWEGWAKVSAVPIGDTAVQNKAKVITEVDPDILVLLEVEDRAALVEFNRQFLSSTERSPYLEVVFMETNDPYGRGIGILAKKGFDLESIKTHVNDLDGEDRPIFDIDLQEYRFRTRSGLVLDLLCTHLAHIGNDAEIFANRQKVQSEHIADLLVKKRTDVRAHPVLLGTLNAPAYGSSITSIIKDTHLRDITKHPHFIGDLDKGKDADYFRLGAYRMGINTEQRDYLMLSDKLFEAIENCGLVRKGMWFNKRPQWDVFGSIKSERDRASEHPLLWCQLHL